MLKLIKRTNEDVITDEVFTDEMMLMILAASASSDPNDLIHQQCIARARLIEARREQEEQAKQRGHGWSK